MIKTVSGEFEPDSPFLRKAWDWGGDGLVVDRAKNTNTMVVMRDQGPRVTMRNSGFTYIPPTP